MTFSHLWMQLANQMDVQPIRRVQLIILYQNSQQFKLPNHAGCSHYQKRLKRSVVGEFNRTQRKAGRGTCSNGSSHNWLRKYQPKLSICPHQEDYCDMCAKLKEGIRAKQTIINHLLASASADPNEISCLENDKISLSQALEDHRHKAAEAHKYYVDATKLCAEEWAEIANLEGRSLSPEENERLTTMKCKFSVVLSVDYQMSKLIPYWGASSQPGSTYFLQKSSHNIYGIVNHATNDSRVYLFDERLGPKNIDHTISYITHHISTLPSWVR